MGNDNTPTHQGTKPRYDKPNTCLGFFPHFASLIFMRHAERHLLAMHVLNMWSTNANAAFMLQKICAYKVPLNCAFTIYHVLQWLTLVMPSVISEATGIVICISPLAALDLYIDTPNRQVNIKACLQQHKELPSSHGETCFSDQFTNDLSKPSLSQQI